MGEGNKGGSWRRGKGVEQREGIEKQKGRDKEDKEREGRTRKRGRVNGLFPAPTNVTDSQILAYGEVFTPSLPAPPRPTGSRGMRAETKRQTGKDGNARRQRKKYVSGHAS